VCVWCVCVCVWCVCGWCVCVCGVCVCGVCVCLCVCVCVMVCWRIHYLVNTMFKFLSVQFHTDIEEHCVTLGSQASSLALVSYELRWAELSSIGLWYWKRKLTRAEETFLREHTDLTWNRSRSKPGLHGDRPATKLSEDGTALDTEIINIKNYIVPHREHGVLPIEKKSVNYV